jgi:hypothetical protein
MHDLDLTEMESFEYDFESESEGGVFNESEIGELASELMEIHDEQELEQFLGDLIQKASKAVGSFIKSPTGKALGGILKGAAKQALPMVGSALGGWVGGDTGSKIGSQLAGLASDKLGLEFEGESYEGESEYENAKDFVRMASEAAAKVASSPQANAANAVRSAVAQAVKTHMPQLLKPAGSGGAAEGRWIRRGNRIVLLGV